MDKKNHAQHSLVASTTTSADLVLECGSNLSFNAH